MTGSPLRMTITGLGEYALGGGVQRTRSGEAIRWTLSLSARTALKAAFADIPALAALIQDGALTKSTSSYLC